MRAVRADGVDVAAVKRAPGERIGTYFIEYAGAPRTIPGWATKLFAWETGTRRGKRPPTPKPLPAWYTPWKAWRLAPAKIR